MCLVPRSDELERQGQRSEIKGQGLQKQKRHFAALSAACVRFMFGKTLLASSWCWDEDGDLEINRPLLEMFKRSLLAAAQAVKRLIKFATALLLWEFVFLRKSPAAILKGFSYFSFLKNTGGHLKCVSMYSYVFIDLQNIYLDTNCMKIS